jgi:hypothetical protein
VVPDSAQAIGRARDQAAAVLRRWSPDFGGPGRAKTRRQNGDDIAERFTKDAAKKTGKSERSVQREAERANRVIVLTDIVNTSLDEGDELDALAKLPEAEQRKLAARAKGDGEACRLPHAPQGT